MASIQTQLAEIRLIRQSLLPVESIAFVDGAQEWDKLVADEETTEHVPPTTNCRFEVKVEDAPIWLEIELPSSYPAESKALVFVKVDDVDRREQDKWQAIIMNLLIQIGNGENPVFELLSIVLPQIHDFQEKHIAAKAAQLRAGPSQLEPGPSVHHALFTSHHLVSMEKRRSIQKWALGLSLRGFVKVGNPGAIYCEGEKANVERFVSNVKAMQWLALHVRFFEPIPVEFVSNTDTQAKDAGKSKSGSWIELEKVGEVLDYMRKLSREEFVLDVGLGRARAGANS